MKQHTHLELIKAKAPAALSEFPSPYTSSVYKYVNTMSYVDMLTSMGWIVKEAIQRTPKGSREFDVFEKHIIKLENPQYVIGEGVGRESLQLIIVNSHNGTCGFQIKFGIYRLVCSNGLVIPIEEKMQLKQIHKNFDPDELLKHILQVVDVGTETFKFVDRMKYRTMTPQEMKLFAMEAMSIRLDTLDVANMENIDSLLEIEREEDSGDNLWVLYNRVQEKLTRGGVDLYTVKGKSRKIRPVTGLNDVEFNTQLGRLALTYLEN